MERRADEVHPRAHCRCVGALHVQRETLREIECDLLAIEVLEGSL